MEFITDRKEQYVQYLYLGDDENVHFVASDGCFSNEDIESITASLEQSEFPKGDGEYMYLATYQPAQLGEYGAVEIAAWFELEEVLFRPIELDQNT